MFHLWMGLPLIEAVKRPRIHHQLFPNSVTTSYKEGFKLSEGIIKGLESKGHVVKEGGISVAQAVAFDQKEKRVFAASDPRKGGKASGV